MTTCKPSPSQRPGARPRPAERGAARLHRHDRPVTKTLWPGQAGTLKLRRQHGEALVCVRYRRSPDGRTRYTTVELIVDEAPLQAKLRNAAIYPIRVRWGEHRLRALVKEAGARWSPEDKLWHLSGKAIKALHLADRVRRK